jgi:hypothetical protein
LKPVGLEAEHDSNPTSSEEGDMVISGSDDDTLEDFVLLEDMEACGTRGRQV